MIIIVYNSNEVLLVRNMSNYKQAIQYCFDDINSLDQKYLDIHNKSIIETIESLAISMKLPVRLIA